MLRDLFVGKSIVRAVCEESLIASRMMTLFIEEMLSAANMARKSLQKTGSLFL